MATGFQYIQRPDYVGNALSGLIGAQQQHEQENAAQDAQAQQNSQQQQQQRIKFLLDQYLKQPGEVQSKLYATAPADIKQYLIDPSLAYNTPDAQRQRQIQETIDRNKLGVAQNFHPTGGDTSAINYDFMTGKNAPEEYQKMGYMRDYLNPQQIGTTMMAPAVKDLATAGNQNAEAGLHTEQAKVVAPEAKSRINLQGAQAGEAGAAAADHMAGAGEKRAKTALLTSTGVDADTGQLSPKLAGYVKMLQSAYDNGSDTGKIINSIKDRPTVIALQNYLATNNPKILSYTALPASARTDLVNIRQNMADVDKIIAAYEPLKNNNSGWTDRELIPAMEYKGGIEPDQSTPLGQLAATLSRFKIQAGARVIKGASRALPALQMAMQHAPSLTDTESLKYSKALQMKAALENAADSILQVAKPGTVSQTGQNMHQPLPSEAPTAAKPAGASGSLGNLQPDGKGGYVYVNP